MTFLNLSSSKAYGVPLRAIWLQSPDVIDIRVTVSSTPSQERVFHFPATAHLHPLTRQLLGVILPDNKLLRIGRWLRTYWDEVPLAEGDPVPAGVVVYDEGALFAYFSIWPNLSAEEPERADRRRAAIYLDSKDELRRIQLPVTIRRRDDALAAAAGSLPTR